MSLCLRVQLYTAAGDDEGKDGERERESFNTHSTAVDISWWHKVVGVRRKRELGPFHLVVPFDVKRGCDCWQSDFTLDVPGLTS